MSPAEQLSNKKAKIKPKVPILNKRPKIWNTMLGRVRERLGLTIKEVSKEAKVSQAVIYAAELGTDIKLKTAARLAKFFGMKIEEIWIGEIKK